MKWGSRGWGDGQFASPNSIAFDNSGNVYVSDAADRIQKFATKTDKTITTSTSDIRYHETTKSASPTIPMLFIIGFLGLAWLFARSKK